MPQQISHEQRVKAVLQGMRRAERDKAGQLSRTTDTLSLIGGGTYGSAEDAQRVLGWLARDADTLPRLRAEHLADVGEMICIVWNGCGSDPAALSQWLNGSHAQLGGQTPRQLLQDGASARLLDAARASFAG
ncbi:DUF2384 domain-containing protein [Xanthomonas sp. AM6]|uniref:antitoxin Xre/MbcA/ParS toxin-binding domain-containing protein n=1 Tax=Xanthomonas sp. AM6 TaxID=2982531 RepID=UPI0021DB2A57|nr:antitoxin Xre/MbcA/ParS toxin-binding domain-containing protein [Xanthomonas sp. AM6]UYB53936.1 DUF2384 domain-containing protein [Xanthomonas sp. AM6]